MSRTYELDFECTNCGNEWVKKIKKGYKANEKRTLTSVRTGVVIMPERSTKLSEIEHVECPKCENTNSVRKKL